MLCDFAGIARSSYYKWLNKVETKKDKENSIIIKELTKIYDDVNGIYGYRRMTMNINRNLNKQYNYKRIYRLMKSMNLQSVIRKKKKRYVKSTPQIIERNPSASPLLHSDRGYQYTSKAFKLKLDKVSATQSMSRVGRCIDNGPIEGFWGIIKSEMYYLRKFDNFDELKLAIDNYIEFYNT